MVPDDRGHVWQTAVAAFNIVPIEQLVIFVMFGEMLVYQPQKLFGNVCCHILVVWWVKPNNVTFSLFFLFLRLFIIFHAFWVTTVFEGLCIWRFGFFKHLSIAGYGRQSVAYRFWKMFYDGQWVI